jgi:hypothetical protein
MLTHPLAGCKMVASDPFANLESTDMKSDLDLNLDSTPIITWLAQQRKAATLDPAALRRSLIARMIWQVSYQRSPGLLANVAYLLGWRTWGEQPRTTLAADICMLRRALEAAGHHLAYRIDPANRGFYIRGRPALDPQLERRMKGAMAEIDPAQMVITRRLTTAQRFAQAMSMIEFVTNAGAYRLQQRQPTLSWPEALQRARQGKVV